jgi:hypothetical protein
MQERFFYYLNSILLKYNFILGQVNDYSERLIDREHNNRKSQIATISIFNVSGWGFLN